MLRHKSLLLTAACVLMLGSVAAFAGGPGDSDHSGPGHARQAFQKGTGVGSLNTPVRFYVVPAHKRLVIEFFSAEGWVAEGETLSRFLLTTHKPSQPAGQAEFTHFISPSFHGPSFSQEVYLVSQPMLMFVKAGDELVLNAVGDGTGGAFMSVSGYLEDTN